MLQLFLIQDIHHTSTSLQLQLSTLHRTYPYIRKGTIERERCTLKEE